MFKLNFNIKFKIKVKKKKSKFKKCLQYIYNYGCTNEQRNPKNPCRCRPRASTY
jgi:hypothetical protein